MRHPYRLYVYFVVIPWGRVQWLRAIRSPRREAHIWYGVLTCLLGRSRYTHCLVGTQDAVLDPSLKGDRFWPTITFFEKYPSVATMVSIPVPTEPDMDALPRHGPRRAWPTLKRWMTGGRTPATDCVQTVISVVRLAGVSIHPRVTTPRELEKALMAMPGAERFGIDHPTV